MRDARRTVLTSMEGMGSFTLPPEAVAILSNFKMASFQVNPGLQPSHTSSVVSSLVDGWMSKNRSLCDGTQLCAQHPPFLFHSPGH